MLFRRIEDKKLAQYAYLIGCQRTGEAMVIDPERDIDRYEAEAAAEGMKIVAVAETHIHADYLSGAREFAAKGATVYVSDEGDADWKYEWAKEYDNVKLVKDGDTFKVGNIQFQVMHTPGHTPEHICFLVTDVGGGADEVMGIASGDFVFVGDVGRPDLLESAAGVVGAMDTSARVLYKSMNRFMALPDYMKVWPGHGAGSACGKALGAIPDSTVGYEKRFNASISHAQASEQDFVDYILDGQPEPPLYFKNMKRLNKMGAKVLGGLPQPRALAVSDLADVAKDKTYYILDTRTDRTAFMRGHLEGALFTPFNKTFNTVAGSLVEEGEAIVLIIPTHQVEEAVRDLVRVGLDHIVGYATPETLAAYAAQGGRLVSMETISFGEAFEAWAGQENVQVLDARGAAEFRNGQVPDAINIAHTRLRARQNELPKGKTLVVHCLSGARAASAASYVARLGFKVVYVDDAFANYLKLASVTA